MTRCKLKYLSVVLVGRQNPQILNHDFLTKYKVLPKKDPFYRKDLANGENPYTEFFSTPPVARIAYGAYSLLVQEDRFQGMDTTGSEPRRSPILEITRKYFGQLLRYTPFRLGGLNLNFEMTFAEAKDEQLFDEAVGIQYSRARRAIAAEDLVPAMTVSFPLFGGRGMIAIAKPKERHDPAVTNFNYEFAFVDTMENFLANLEKIGDLSQYSAAFFDRVGVQHE